MSDQARLPNAPRFPRLRSDLRCSLHEGDGDVYYTIEDLASGSFFRIGVGEWELASRLDGSTSLADAQSQVQRERPDVAMSLQRAEQTVHSLLAAGLVLPPNGENHPGAGGRATTAPAQALAKLNPFFLRIPLFCPDRQLAAALPWCRWMFSRRFFLLWTIVVLSGGYCIGSQWDRFAETARIYMSPRGWASLLVVWCGLKVVHEFAHGIVCKRFGGNVGAAGVALILFSPVAFVDVTSAWRFRSKWRRIFTSSAGIYLELFVAGVAALVWNFLDAGAASQLCHSVVMLASVSTLLFNANPLMRFDGYFILSDLLEIPNLYAAGQHYVRSRLRRLFLAMPTRTAIQVKRSRQWIVKAYGVAAAIWRIIVCASMILLASTLFHGAGLVVAMLGVFLWIALPCLRFAKLLLHGQQGARPNRIRFAALSALTIVCIVGILRIPWPGGVSAPAVVVYAPDDVVRTATDGFIEQVHVASGQQVSRNQVLISLSNEQLLAELALAKLAARQSELRARVLLHREDQQAGYQAELEQLAAIQARLNHLQSQVDGLQIRAALDGVVLSKRLQDLVGRFTPVGTPLLRIAREHQKEIQVSISEAHIESFAESVGKRPHVRVKGQSRAVQAGPLVKVDPQASVALNNTELGAAYGGPLAVRETPPDERRPDSRGAQFELVSPRFHGVVALPPDAAVQLRAGQLAKVRIHHGRETVGRQLFRAVQHWIRQRLDPLVAATHGS